MATIREWLNLEEFDWSSGRIVYHRTEGGSPGWASGVAAEDVGVDHPVLDREFDDGFGAPECPRFVAEDSGAIYFPTQYDGATDLQKVWKNLDRYLDVQCPTPYPGG